MTPEQWQKVEAVLQQALDAPAQDRASFLDEACSGDQLLLEEATSLLKAYEEVGDFIEEPAIAQDARLIIGAANDKIGQELGAYKIVSRLGAGGMGEVYLAEDSRLGRQVAIKILPSYFAADDARLRRFQREARAASALNHPNILTIHEVGETDGIYFIATEFIEGLTIRQLLASSELSAGAILDIAAQVASALAAAHAAGIVHRDIKPENIMRRSDGLVKILDFGIAKLLEPESQPDADNRRVAGETHTEAGLVMGTVSYMSPEQARGLPVDERTDIWSFGVVLYEMLSKRLPFRGATRMDTLVAILDREPVPLCEVAGRLNANSRLPQVIDRCLRKEAGERYRTAHELIADLRNVVVDPEVGKAQAVSVTSNEAAAREREEFRRRDLRRRYLMALTVFALLLVTSIVIILSRRSGAHWSLTGSGSSETAKVYSQMTEAERLTFIDQQEQRISTMM
jgi:serine/threonine protein kinase